MVKVRVMFHLSDNPLIVTDVETHLAMVTIPTETNDEGV